MSREAEIIESFRNRGILEYVEAYRHIRDEIARKINYLRNIKIDVSSYEERFNMLKKRAVETASLIKKSDQEFITGITSVISDLNKLYDELEIVYSDVNKITENLKKLEELYNSGKISQKVYKRLKKEYLDKIARLSLEGHTIIKKS